MLWSALRAFAARIHASLKFADSFKKLGHQAALLTLMADPAPI